MFKSRRVAQHRQLLEVARATLDAVKVELFTDGKGLKEAEWTDATRALVPLEYRRWVDAHLRTLVYGVHNIEEQDLGDRDWIRELSESITVVRSVLIGLPDDTRRAFKAEAFARAQAHLDELVAKIARLMATDGGWVLTWSDTLASELASAKEARGWFSKQEDLDAANALRRQNTLPPLPRPYLYIMDELIRDGEATLANARKYVETHYPRRKPSGPERQET